MRVQLSVILDFLARWKPTLTFVAELPLDAAFSAASLPYPGQTEFLPDVLYIMDGHETLSGTLANSFIVCNYAESSKYKETGKLITVDYPDSKEQLCVLISTFISMIQEWENSLNLKILEGATEQDLVDLTDSIIVNPMLILDPIFRYLAGSKQITENELLFYDVKTQVSLKPEIVLGILRRDRPALEAIRGRFKNGQEYRIYAGPAGSDEILTDLKIEGSAVLYIIVRLSHSPLTNGLISLLDIFIDKLQKLFLLRNNSSSMGGKITIDEYVFRLLVEQNQDAVMAAQRIGLPIDSEYLIAVVDGDFTQEETEDALSRLIVTIVPGSRAFHNQQLHIYVPVDTRNLSSQYYVAHQEQLLQLIGTESGISFGLSGTFKDITQLRLACAQAQSAKRLSVKMHILPFKKPSENEQLKRYSDVALLDAIVDYGKHPVESYAPRSYILMREADMTNKNNNCFVAKNYILCGCNSAQTSKQIFMHKNSVNYRIERIKAIYGLDFTDTNENLLFVIACIGDELK